MRRPRPRRIPVIQLHPSLLQLISAMRSADVESIPINEYCELLCDLGVGDASETRMKFSDPLGCSRIARSMVPEQVSSIKLKTDRG